MNLHEDVAGGYAGYDVLTYDYSDDTNNDYNMVDFDTADV